MNNVDALLKKKIFTTDNKKYFSFKTSFIIVNLIALFISRVVIIDKLSPFGISFLSAFLSKGTLPFTVAISTSIGIISVYKLNGYIYLIPIWITLTGYNILFKDNKPNVFKTSFFTSTVLIFIKLFSLVNSPYLTYNFVLIIFEGVLVFALAYIFNYSSRVFNGKYNRLYTNEEIISLCIVISLAIAGIRDLEIISFQIKDIVGVFLVIIFSYYKGITMGTTIGLTIGLITSISSNDITVYITVYAISGLLSGLFKELGKIGVSIGFLLGSLMITFYTNGLSSELIGIKETILAAVIFILLSRYIKKSSNIFLGGVLNDLEKEGIYTNRIKDMIHKRLNEFSEVYDELATTFERIVNKEKLVDENDISKFIDKISNKVCKNCPMNRVCWENDFYTTYNSMFEIISIIENYGELNKNTLPNIFKKRCIRIEMLINKCNYHFDIYKLNYKWQKKISESRKMTVQQLKGISKIIKDLSEEVLGDIKFKEDVEKTIWNELIKLNIPLKEVTVMENKNGKFELFIQTKSNDTDLLNRYIIPVARNVIGYDLICEKTFIGSNKGKKNIRYKLVKANKYNAITKICKADDSFNYVSGDSYTFGERNNDYFIALSDGMGVGRKAHEESSIAISLLEKFLEAGFNKELALKTINSILVLKPNDEMFTTLDLSIVDLYSGKSKFIKVGSAPTFIKKKDTVKIINSNSLPIGILKDVDFNVYEEELENGDFIIMMSDGVLDSNNDEIDKENWMKNVIVSINTVNPQVLANEIMERALNVLGENKKDDMTILVTKIWKVR